MQFHSNQSYQASTRSQRLCQSGEDPATAPNYQELLNVRFRCRDWVLPLGKRNSGQSLWLCSVSGPPKWQPLLALSPPKPPSALLLFKKTIWLSVSRDPRRPLPSPRPHPRLCGLCQWFHSIQTKARQYYQRVYMSLRDATRQQALSGIRVISASLQGEALTDNSS